MPRSITLTPAEPPDIPEVQRLFREYAAWTGVDLSFQNFEEELATLPGDYAPPHGVLFVARVDDRIAGCVAGHPWRDDACEMKRLYVRDEFRGLGLGRALIERVIDWARSQNHREMRLDTLPVMDQAQSLYARLGFHEVPAYRPNPVPGARYLALSLR